MAKSTPGCKFAPWVQIVHMNPALGAVRLNTSKRFKESLTNCGKDTRNCQLAPFCENVDTYEPRSEKTGLRGF